MSSPAQRAREHVLDARADTVETVLQSANAVAAEWDGPATTDPGDVAAPLRAELEAEGAWADLCDVLAGAVRATGHSLSATPVADPPYVTATSRGPMLRATVPTGRLVVLLRAFDVERTDGGGPRYVRGPTTPAEAVRVTFEQSG